MTDKQQPNALRIAGIMDGEGYPSRAWRLAAATELRRLHAENETLRAAPQPSPAAQGDALDAGRYRWLRSTPSWDVLSRLFELRDVALDRRIDAARATQEGK